MTENKEKDMMKFFQRLRTKDMKDEFLSLDQKLALCEAITSNSISRKEVTSRYNIPKQRLSTMIKAFSDGNLTSAGTGRPSLLSKCQKRALQAEVFTLMKNSNASNKKRKRELVIKYINLTNEERNQGPGASGISKSSMFRIMKDLNWKPEGVQKQTELHKELCNGGCDHEDIE